MSHSKIVLAAALLAVSGGAAFAQMDAPTTGFYADPVLPDPSPVQAHVYPPAEATADVAEVTPAAAAPAKARAAACTARNPCAITAPPARG